MSDAEPALLEWGVAVRSLPGEAESGDLAVVRPFRRGALAAAVDGLGHGPEAARAAKGAAEVLEGSAGDPVAQLARRCHEALRESRGVVMSLASFDGSEDTMTWLAVGNVEGRLVRGSDPEEVWHESMVLLPGIVGYRLPELRPVTVHLRTGDLLILSTDGIRTDFSDPKDVSRPVDEIAQRILDEESRDTDDALVVVVRYLGEVR